LTQQNYYHDFVNTWKILSELHLQLLDLTSKEYLHLLSNEFEQLESLIIQKELIINQINQIDLKKSQLILQIALETGCSSEELNTFKSTKKLLYKICNIDEKNNPEEVLEKYNILLLEIISKIQIQNKKNRLYLNKALFQLTSLQSELIGKQKNSTYNHIGEKRNLSKAPMGQGHL